MPSYRLTSLLLLLTAGCAVGPTIDPAPAPAPITQRSATTGADAPMMAP